MGVSAAWLERHPLSGTVREAWLRRLLTVCVPAFEKGSVLATAVEEFRTGVERLLGHRPRRSGAAHRGFSVERTGSGPPGAFALTVYPHGVRLAASDETGVLYGVFRLLQTVALGLEPEGWAASEAPERPLRMLNHWDNLDGSVERGYAGRSLFFREGRVLPPGPRLAAYARLCASVGLNAVALNNVNVHEPETRLITSLLPAVARVADALRPWGIRVFLSANFAAPLTLGATTTADPLDPGVISWWTECAARVWAAIPDFGGFVVKADSEGRPGPFTYGRDHADGANLLARAVAPFGGRVLWRCFVYNAQQDWRDRTTDRARAAFDHFRPLDGRFLPNVSLQIKNGPMDFQPREPVSPLLGAMPATSQVLELQATQEYLGQQRHLCYLPEQWRTYLRFDTGRGRGTAADVVDGFVAVANVGDDENWTGHDLAQANWYGYGRLAWNASLDPAVIAEEWAGLTFGPRPAVLESVKKLLLGSWETYEAYTAPLGLGWMVNPSHHYGPNPDGYEYDRWGTYHFADREGVGVDRTATGSDYAAQYPTALAERFADPQLCPEELLLFFHHLPYGHRLRSGTTLLQRFYDLHFQGAERAASYGQEWERLKGLVPPEVFERVALRFAHQKEHAALWRDVVNTSFYRRSGVPDAHGRKIYP